MSVEQDTVMYEKPPEITPGASMRDSVSDPLLSSRYLEPAHRDELVADDAHDRSRGCTSDGAPTEVSDGSTECSIEEAD